MSFDPAAPVVARQALPRPDNFRGLFLMGLAFFIFAAADVQAKLLTGHFHPLQVAWTRQAGLLAGAAVIIAMQGPSVFRTQRPGLQVLRGVLAVISSTFFVFALGYVALADAVAVTFVAPFMVTILGALILREKVGIRRWSAVAAGFAGTLIVIRPGFGVIHPAVLLVVLAATAFALRQIVSRLLATSDRTVTTVAYTSFASVLLLTLPLPFYWSMPQSGWEILLLLGMASCAGIGELVMIKALETTQAIVLAPVHYTLIIWATFYGWMIFGQLPDRWTWLGEAIIVATGLYLIHREWKLSKIKR